MVLERYDDAVIRAVTSPITGIQRTAKFPPSIAEFVEFIDAHVQHASYVEMWEAHAERQLREREEIEAQEHQEPLAYRQAAAARILAEYKSKLTPQTIPQRDTWKPLTDEGLQFLYGKKETT